MANFFNNANVRTLKRKFIEYKEEKDVGLHENRSNVEYLGDSRCDKKTITWIDLVCNVNAPNTLESVVLKSFLGFMVGVFLTYCVFLFFHIGVNFSLKTTTYICGFLGVFLCLGLALSSSVRCYILLLIPVFFSKQGREALLAYALFLAFTGPAKNTMHNIGVLSESMTCGQEMIWRTLKQITEIVKEPHRSIKESIKVLTKSMKKIAKSMEILSLKIGRLVLCILEVIKKSALWLDNIVIFCNQKIGTPFQRCMKTFDEAIADCKAKLGVVDFFCHIVHIIKSPCYSFKFLNFMYLLPEFPSGKALRNSKNFLKQFNNRIKNLLYVSVEYSHSHKLETSAANITKEITKTILQKTSKKVEKLQNLFSFCGFMFGFLFLLVLFKVYNYKYKFLSSDQYDNVYISKHIVDLDIERSKLNRETVLPLEEKEKKLYAEPTAFRLLEEEKSRIAQSIFLLCLTSFKIITFLVVDYSLFWVLMMIYEVGRIGLKSDETNKIVISLKEKNFLANFYQKIGQTLEVPKNPNLHLNPLHCIPDPALPDIERYIQIGVLVVLSWILTVTEAYGLRLRNVVMSYYYPNRAKERSLWLYNHILRSRGSYLRAARRKRQKKFCKKQKPTELRKLFCYRNKDSCNTCGTKVDVSKRCRTPDCCGKFCTKCFDNEENICTTCNQAIQCGYDSDISEEENSSDEEYYQKKKEYEVYRMESLGRNRMPDFARLGDMYHDKAALQKRLKEVLLSHIQTIEREKNNKFHTHISRLQKIKTKLRSILTSFKKKRKPKVTEKKSIIKQKSKEKVTKLKNYKEHKKAESKFSGSSKPTRSRVSFKDVEEESLKLDYKMLRDIVKAEIESLKNEKKIGEKNGNHAE